MAKELRTGRSSRARAVYRPPTLLEFTVTAGPARPTGRFELSEAGPGRTMLTFTLDLQPRGLTRLIGGMVTKQMHVEVRQLQQLKDDLER
jgi:hypothetical protein